MGWVSGARLTAASSQAGALGILAGGTMTLAELERAVNEVTEATGFPLVVPDDLAESRLPTEEELRIVREVLDPSELRRSEVK